MWTVSFRFAHFTAQSCLLDRLNLGWLVVKGNWIILHKADYLEF